jgi:hypothetical protein
LVGDRTFGAESNLLSSDHALQIGTHDKAFLVIPAETVIQTKVMEIDACPGLDPGFAGMPELGVSSYGNAEAAMFNGERS